MTPARMLGRVGAKPLPQAPVGIIWCVRYDVARGPRLLADVQPEGSEFWQTSGPAACGRATKRVAAESLSSRRLLPSALQWPP